MWVKRNSGKRYNSQTVEAWLQAEVGSSITAKEYAKRQSRSGWGGSIEILAFVLTKNTTVWVWIPIGRGRFRRTACFQAEEAGSGDRIDLCRSGGVHYDIVHLNKAEIISQMQVKLKFLQTVRANGTVL